METPTTVSGVKKACMDSEFNSTMTSLSITGIFILVSGLKVLRKTRAPTSGLRGRGTRDPGEETKSMEWVFTLSLERRRNLYGRTAK
jgi:hypothetical protein